MTSLANLTPEELSNLPALDPPPGVVPNFLSPENQNRPLLVVTSLELGIMILFVLNRFYFKSFSVRKYSWDDLTVLLAVIGSIAYYVASTWGAQKGRYGIHQWDISLIDLQSSDKQIPSYLLTVLASPTLLFTKITFLILYLQIFQPLRWLRISAYIGIFVTTAFYLGMTVAQFALSTPGRADGWLSRQIVRNQHQVLAVAVPQSAIGLVIDLYILVLPLIAVSQMQLAPRRKVGVVLIFMTGILACLASTLSVYYRYVLYRTQDLTWNVMPVNTVTLTEMFVGVICSSMPSAAHTFRQTCPSFNALKTQLYSRSKYFRSVLKRTNKTKSATEKPIHIEPRRPYINLENSAAPKCMDLAQYSNVHTVIGTGVPDDVERNGIYVDHRLQTNWEQV